MKIYVEHTKEKSYHLLHTLQKVHLHINIKMVAAWSYDSKVVYCYDDKYTKEVKFVNKRHQDAITVYIVHIIEEVEWYKDMIRTEFNKPLKISAIESKNL